MRLPPLHGGVVLARRKRFLVDLRLDDGQEVTAHCANPGAMTSCIGPGWRALASHHPGVGRKLPWSLQLTLTPEGVPVLVNTAVPNRVVEEALRARALPPFADRDRVQAEVRVGSSRVDFALDGEGLPRAYVEVKSVTWRVAPGLAAFPDARSARATRHLAELCALVEAGHPSALVFLVGRGDVEAVRAAAEVDATYARALEEAMARGVQVLARRLRIEGEALSVGEALPLA